MLLHKHGLQLYWLSTSTASEHAPESSGDVKNVGTVDVGQNMEYYDAVVGK